MRCSKPRTGYPGAGSRSAFGSPRKRPAARAYRRSNSWWVGAAALAGIGMVAAVLVWALGEGQWLSLPKTYQTTHGGQGCGSSPTVRYFI